jgi:hypothetical protein
MADYKWRNNIACVATYRILESDRFLDQFEDTVIPFSEAGTTKLSDLRYFPKTTGNANILEILSLEISRQFIKYLVKLYTVRKENSQNTTAEIIQGLATIFANGDSVVRDIAAYADEAINFPDEG